MPDVRTSRSTIEESSSRDQRRKSRVPEIDNLQGVVLMDQMERALTQ